MESAYIFNSYIDQYHIYNCRKLIFMLTMLIIIIINIWKSIITIKVNL